MNQQTKSNGNGKLEADLTLDERLARLYEVLKTNNGSIWVKSQGQWSVNLGTKLYGDEVFGATQEEIDWRERRKKEKLANQ